MFNRIKNFFKDIKNAFKKLFGIEDKESKVQEVAEYTETTYNEDGSVDKVTNIKMSNPNAGSWKDIGNKISDKIKEGINWCIEHPAKVFFSGGIISVGLSQIERIQRMFLKNKESRMKARMLYDNHYNSHYTTKRPLTPKETRYLNLQRETGRNMGEILSEMGLI